MQLFLTNITSVCSFLVNCVESVGYSCASIFDALKNGTLTVVEPISGNPEFISGACDRYRTQYAITVSRFDGFPSWEACKVSIDWLTQQAQQECNAQEAAAWEIRDARNSIYLLLTLSIVIMLAAHCACCCYENDTNDATYCCGLFRFSPKPRSPEYDDGQKYTCGRRLC